MNPKVKSYLRFTIIYWLLAIAGLVLFGVAFDKVHINRYGLKRNYYDSRIDEDHYAAGVYHKGIGFYFVEFPSSKKYLEGLTINVTNADMNVLGLEYTLVYRINPEYLYDLYQAVADTYEHRLIAEVNVSIP